MELRHDWYQTNERVTVDIFAKNVIADTISYELEQGQGFVLRGQKDGPFEKRLHFYAKVTVEQIECLSTKINVVFSKCDPQAWPSLESIQEARDESKPPAYPTSSKHRVDWEQVKPEAEDANNNIDTFFKDLYANASEEARRAMNKSFVESGGTVLSTNWNDVGTRKVTPKPPNDHATK